VVADIPGLIEGASDGKGLGHQFLRHIERARVLVLLLDLAETAPASPEEQERVLLRELEQHQPDLVERPRIAVGSRADIATGSASWDGAMLSAVTGAGVDELVGKMLQTVAGARSAEPEVEGFVVHRPVPQGIRIERDLDGSLLVVGRQAERAVALSDLTNPEALAFVQERLRRLGVDKALARAGAKEGETVHIGAFAFDYFVD